MESSENDLEIQKFLKEAGFDENTQIDPASRIALQELLTNSTKPSAKPDLSPTSLQSDDEVEITFSSPPVPQVDTSPIVQRHVSDLSGGAFMDSPYQLSGDSAASTAGLSAEERNLSKEDRILLLLERQTSMLTDVHRRIDHLTAVVQRQQQPVATTTNLSILSRHDLNRRIDELSLLVEQYKQRLETRQSAAHTVPLPRPAGAEPPRNGPRGLEFPMEHLLHEEQQPQVPPPPGRLSRVSKIMKLFFALRRRQAPNFDGGLIIKVLVMMTILLSRLSNRRKRAGTLDGGEEDWMWEYRFYFMIVLVIGGFLVQSGFIKFTYTFFVKENYPARIWEGEEIEDVEREALEAQQRQRRPPPPPRPRDDENAPQEPGWRQTFLAGGIAPNNDPEHRAGGVLRVVQDVGFFIGSFFLSIFPMWRPEALAGPRPRVVNNEDDADDGIGLPEVRPPQDPAEAEEED
jgi:hypothetical protein